MGRFAKDNGGGDFPQAPTGTHLARCFRLVDLGTHHGEYQGMPNVRNQVLVSWELPTELMEDGKPFAVSQFYTNSLSEKAKMRHHLEAWGGKQFSEEELDSFDLMNILGKACMVTVVLSDKNKAVVSAVSGLPKGIQVPPQINPSSSFWIDEWDDKVFEGIPKGIQDIIKKSDEFKAMTGESKPPKSNGGSPFADMEDDIPFANPYRGIRSYVV